jgi:hypothetical protein
MRVRAPSGIFRVQMKRKTGLMDFGSAPAAGDDRDRQAARGWSGKTASILLFSVCALNGLTM